MHRASAAGRVQRAGHAKAEQGHTHTHHTQTNKNKHTHTHTHTHTALLRSASETARLAKLAPIAASCGGSHPAAPLPPGWWDTQWDDPQGEPLRLATFKGRPLVINFWATWCTPCVEEMPLLDAFYRENKARNWQMIGIAIDQP